MSHPFSLCNTGNDLVNLNAYSNIEIYIQYLSYISYFLLSIYSIYICLFHLNILILLWFDLSSLIRYHHGQMQHMEMRSHMCLGCQWLDRLSFFHATSLKTTWCSVLWSWLTGQTLQRQGRIILRPMTIMRPILLTIYMLLCHMP